MILDPRGSAGIAARDVVSLGDAADHGQPAGGAVAPRNGSLVEHLRAHRWQIAAVVVAFAVVVAGKQYYRHASAGELRWILAPTAQLAGVVSGGDFVYEAGAGWIDRDLSFLIAPPCAGLHFALAAFLALALGALPAMRTARGAAIWLAAAAVLAYAATLVVNTTRIAIAIAMHTGTLEVGTLDRGELHRLEGIVVYLGGLCALYTLARAIHTRRQRHELAR